MTVKEPDIKKSVNADKKTDILKNSSSTGNGAIKPSSKKKGIPNSGTNVFLKEPLDNNKVSLPKSTSKDNYWDQGNLNNLGQSIRNLNDNSIIDLDKFEGKKTLAKDTLSKPKLDNPKKDDDATVTSESLQEEKTSKLKGSKKESPKKDSVASQKGTLNIKKASVVTKKGALNTKKASVVTKKGALNTKKATSQTSTDTLKIPKATSKTPKATSKTPKATSKTPKVTSKTPKATSKTPKATSKTPKVTSKTPKATSKTPKATSKTPKATSKTPKATSKTPKATSIRKPIVKKPTNINKQYGKSKTLSKSLKSNISTKVDVKKIGKDIHTQNNKSQLNASSEKNKSKVNSKIVAPIIQNVRSKKNLSFSNILIIISVLLVFVIGFLVNSFVNKGRLDEVSIATKATDDVSLAKNNSEVFEATYKSNIIDVPTIIKPTVNEATDAIPYEILIEKGMSAKVVANLISASGYQDEDAVLKYFIDNGISKKINVGTYYLIPSMSLSDIVDKITIKDNFTMVIYPGMTLAQIDSILSQRNLCVSGAFIEECTSICDEYGLSFVEGWFYPGKYDINRDLDVRELCLNMYYAMLNALLPFLDDIAKSNYSIEQTLIIASLIQAETNNINQMPLISEVIHNRLKADMPLGINATTCYELGVYKSNIDQSVYDTITDFNTRRKKGLVPSAISTISFDALKASVHPSVGDYLYYNHTKDGDMLMAKTYEKHLENIEENK